MSRSSSAVSAHSCVNGTAPIAGFAAALALGILLLASSSALAHVRWFVDPNDPSLQTLQGFSLTDVEVLIWVALACVVVAASVFIDRKLPSIGVVDSKTRHDLIEIMRIFVGMSFLLTAYDGALIAPHFQAFGTFGISLLFLQAIIGIMLIANRFLQHAAILMIILYLGMVVKFGFFSALEYCNVIGIGLFILFNNLQSEEMQRRYKPYSVAALRIFTGIALLALAIGEKLQGAILGQAFVAEYQWNFMQLLGFEWFDDRLFVLSAGMVEAIFGVLLILGTTTRLTILALSAVMALSNVVLIIQGKNADAMVEFIGHLPLIATALILLFLGSGQRLRVTDWFGRQAMPAARSASAS